MWDLLWSQSGGDVVKVMTMLTAMQCEQLKLESARQLAEDERQRRRQLAEDEHVARVNEMEDDRAKRRRTMDAESKLQDVEYNKRRKIAEVEEETARVRLEKMKMSTSRQRTLKIISASELVRVFRLKFKQSFYTKCEYGSCKANVCSARVHVVVLKSYKNGCTNEELLASTKIACKNHKSEFEETLGTPVVSSIDAKHLSVWLSNVDIGSTKGVCMLCGSGDAIDVYDYHVSHDESKSTGGNNSRKNLLVGHHKCNLEQGETSGDSYRRGVGAPPVIAQPTSRMECWARPIKSIKVLANVMKMMSSQSKTSYTTSAAQRIKRWLKANKVKQRKLTINVNL